MKKIAYIIIPWAISFLFSGCAHDDSEMFDREALVNLNISVALSDISQSGTRAVRHLSRGSSK